MLASFASWWLARIIELMPNTWISALTRPPDGVVVEAGVDGCETVSLRRRGQLTATTLGAAARLRRRRAVLLHPPPATVLTKTHVVPSVPQRQLGAVLRHELARITPFAADDLFWRFDAQPRAGDRGRLDVTLTMVPRKVLAPALAALDGVGLRADGVEVTTGGRVSRLPIGSTPYRAMGATRFLAWACASLAIAALLIPVVLQTLALRRVDTAIADLQPTITQVDTLRRALAAGDAGHDILVQETARIGDVLQTLATVTRILPDDTYLTDFALRERQMTLSGRSASAPRLITGLSADPAIRNAAFAAPVTRIDGVTVELFSIKAEIAR
jgi:general secretion pathway protein L